MTMRLGIKGKQVLGVTSLVGAVVVVVSLAHLARLARVGLEESRARAELLANAIFHRAREVVNEDVDPYQALRADPGLRAILESSAYSKNVISAAMAGISIVASSSVLVVAAAKVDSLMAKPPWRPDRSGLLADRD